MIKRFLASAPNPFDGITPDFTVFGVEFSAAWQKLLAGAWGLAFVAVGFGAIRAIVELQSARRNGYHADLAERTDSVKRSFVALGGLASLGLIFGAVLAVF